MIERLCPDGVEFRLISDVYTRLRGTPITASKMKEVAAEDGELLIFAGGKTKVRARLEDVPNANVVQSPAVLVQSRGIIDAIYCDVPFAFKNEMWAYTHSNATSVKYLYYVLKNNIEVFRNQASVMGSLPQISVKATERFRVPIPPMEIAHPGSRPLHQIVFAKHALLNILTKYCVFDVEQKLR